MKGLKVSLTILMYASTFLCGAAIAQGIKAALNGRWDEVALMVTTGLLMAAVVFLNWVNLETLKDQA